MDQDSGLQTIVGAGGEQQQVVMMTNGDGHQQQAGGQSHGSSLMQGCGSELVFTLIRIRIRPSRKNLIRIRPSRKKTPESTFKKERIWIWIHFDK